MSERSLHLGETVDPATHERAGEAIELDGDDLTTHAVIVGMTGSGKTGLGVVLLEEALLDGVPALIIDPKGDLGNLLLTFPDLAPADFEPWAGDGTTGEDAAKLWTEGLAGWGLDGERIAALKDAADFTIYTPGSSAGVPLNVIGSLEAPATDDAETRQDEIQGYVSGLLGLVGADADPLSSPEHILLSTLIDKAWNEGVDLDLAALIGQVQDPPVRKLGVLELDAFFPAKDRTKLATKLNGLVASPAFAAWGMGPSADPARMLRTEDGRPRAAIVSLAHLSDEERQFVVTLLLSKMVTWMRGESGTDNLRALIYMDEVFGFVPPTAEPPSKRPILTILKQARAFGVGMVLSTQNPVDVDYKALSNAGTWMIGRLQTERDKARLLEGMEAVSGDVDVGELDVTISSLGKREFILHQTGSSAPSVFTSRWAMSYLRGPLTRDQIATLTADAPERAVLEGPPPEAPTAGDAPLPPPPYPTTDAPAADEAGAAASVAPPGDTPSTGTATPLADDATTVAPKVAEGTAVRYLDPAAPWAGEVGAVATGTTVQAGLVARVHLRFDEVKADLDTQQEWEAVLFPLSGPADPEATIAVDYDDRDLRAEAPAGLSYVLPEAKIETKTYFKTFATDLKNHLHRTQQVDVFVNPELKLYSRIGETSDEFATRCGVEAESRADQEQAKITEKLRGRSERIEAAIAKAHDRVEELEVDVSTRKRDTVLSGLGSLAGAVLGGRRSARSITRAASSALSKGGQVSRTSQRVETAQNRVDDKLVELEELEADLADQLVAIDDRWNDAAAQIETLPVGLEKTDITVDEVSLVWIPTS